MRPGLGRCRFPAVSPVVIIANVALLVALTAGVAAPETVPAPKVEILGLWKGTSVCAKVEGNEFCHDETVIYNFIDVPSRPTTVALKAGRIIDGSFVRTYDLFFNYRPEKSSWSCEFDQGEVHAVWEYVVSADGMTGTAKLLPELKVVRSVTAKRTAREQVLEPRP